MWEAGEKHGKAWRPQVLVPGSTQDPAHNLNRDLHPGDPGQAWNSQDRHVCVTAHHREETSPCSPAPWCLAGWGCPGGLLSWSEDPGLHLLTFVLGTTVPPAVMYAPYPDTS